jgi:hypothetical protein
MGWACSDNDTSRPRCSVYRLSFLWLLWLSLLLLLLHLLLFLLLLLLLLLLRTEGLKMPVFCREAEREIMLRSVQDPEQRIELERRFTADRSAATRQVLELASRQDRLLRHRSLELGVGDAHPNRTASPTFSARDVPSSPNILTLIDKREGTPMDTPLDSRPRPASVTVSSAEAETLLLSAAKAGSRSLPVMGYYPSKVLKSPFLSPAAPGRPKKRIEPFSQSSSPVNSTLVSPESSFTAISRSPDENTRCMSPLKEAPQQQRSRSQLGGEREREWERGGGMAPMRRAKTALDGRMSDVPAAHARAHHQDSPSNRSSPPMNSRSYSLYQGMMHALKETSVPRTPMSRSPRSLDQRSSSSLDGSIVSEMSMPSVSSSMYSSAAPRCSTPQHLRNQHWATATRDAIKVGGKWVLFCSRPRASLMCFASSSGPSSSLSLNPSPLPPLPSRLS